MNIQIIEKWLKFIAIVHVIAGLSLIPLVYSSFAAPYFNYLQSIFSNPNPESLKFLVGVFGPTVASWGLLFYYSVDKAFESRTTNDWWFLVASVVMWAVLDTLFSFNFSIKAHLYLNSLVALLIILPLILTRRFFRTHEN